MIKLEDNLYKERRPEETIEKCMRILDELGVEIEEILGESGMNSHWCVIRVYYKGEFVAQSGGKGKTREYSRASGYAETLERLQCSLAHIYSQAAAYYNEEITLYDKRFVRFPDDKKEFNKKEFIENDHVFSKIREYEGEYKEFKGLMEDILQKWAGAVFDTYGFVPKVKYNKTSENKSVYINELFIRENMYGSNGFSSGNSKYEALLQGIGEILERYIKYKAFERNLCLPVIEKKDLKKYKYSMGVINKIEKSGRYKIEIRDSSLGIGVPVLCSILYDRQTRGYRVNYASFPIFEVALERTLNETLQGYDLEYLPTTETFRSYDANGLITEIDGIRELGYNTTPDAIRITANNHNGRGIFKDKFFSYKFDYDYVPWDEPKGKNNKEMFYSMCDLVREKFNDEVLYKDCGFLGFNAYSIVCVNMAVEQYVRTKHYMSRYIHDRKGVEETIFGDGDISENDIVKYKLDEKRGLSSWVLGKPLIYSEIGSSNMYLGFLEYVKGNYTKASSLFMKMPSEYSDGVGIEDYKKDYWWCLANYVGMLDSIGNTEDIERVLNNIYNENVVCEISEIVKSSRKLVEALFRDRFSEICLIDWGQYLAGKDLHIKLNGLKDERYTKKGG